MPVLPLSGRQCVMPALYADFLADVRKAAFVAVRFRPCGTYIPSVIDESVAKITSLLWRNDLPESHLHFLRLFDSIHKANPVDEPDAVGIRHDSRLSEYVAHDQIRALSPDAGELQ